jgi:hypothetical protein
MSIPNLREALNDNNPYMDVSKEDVIQEFYALFAKFIANGDTKFEARPGICSESTCACFEYPGFAFVGNKTGDYFTLVFTKVDDDFKACSRFEFDEEGIRHPVWFNPKSDETIIYPRGSGKYLMGVACRSAFNELYSKRIKIISHFEWVKWMNCHENLYKSFKLPPILWRNAYKFYSLYQELEEFTNISMMQTIAAEAMAEYDKLLPTDDLGLLSWILDNADEEGFLDYCYNYADADLEGDTIAVRGFENLKFKEPGFVLVIRYFLTQKFKFEVLSNRYNFPEGKDPVALSKERFHAKDGELYMLNLLKRR